MPEIERKVLLMSGDSITVNLDPLFVEGEIIE